ncbi:MAG TPA: O-antigen ligase family protein [Candidatus Paceibacterota bacterium]
MNIFKQSSWAGFFVAVSIFILPFVYSRHLFYAGVNSKVFFWLFVVVLAGFFCVYKIWVRGLPVYIDVYYRPLLVSIIALLFVLFLSSFFGVYLEQSLFSNIIRSTGVLFLTLIVFLSWWTATFLSQEDWSLVRWAVALSASVASFLMILGVEGLGFSGRLFGFINLDIAGLSFANTTFAGVYLFLAFIFTVIEWLRSDSYKAKKVLIGLLIIQFLSPIFINLGILLGRVPLSELSNPAMFLGSARATSATLFLFLIWIFGLFVLKKFLGQRQKLIWSVWTGFFIVFICASVFLLFSQGSFVQEKYIESSTAARLIVWNVGLEAFKDRPLLGWGPENFSFGFVGNFNNALYLKENLGETWFDRAHNVLVDILVSVGILGLLAHLILIIVFIFTLIKSYKRKFLTDIETMVLAMLPLWHFLQLQTGFDTVASYALGGVIIGYVLWLEGQLYSGRKIILDFTTRKIIAIVLLLLVSVGFYRLILDEYIRQRSLSRIFQTNDSQKQIEYIHSSLDGAVGFESIRLSLNSLIDGTFYQLPKLNSSQQQYFLLSVVNQINVYEYYLKEYIKIQPNDYRARMNYAYLLTLKNGFGGENKLDEVEVLVGNSYKMSPNHPLTYVLHSLIYLYQGEIKIALEKINEGINLNPEIEFTKEVKNHILRQENTLPEIALLHLRNM